MAVLFNRRRGPRADRNTLLLLHGNSFADASSYQNPVTNNGVTISNEQSKFGKGSLYFNGSSFLQVYNLKEFPSGTEDFTVDFWWRDDNSEETSAIFSHAFPGSPGYGVLFFFRQGGEWLGYTTENTLGWTGLSGAQMGQVSNAWVHFAVVRYNKTYYMYQDGKLLSTYSDETEPDGLADAIHIGKYDYVAGPCVKGFLEEFRISNIARWTSNFTPPSAPY